MSEVPLYHTALDMQRFRGGRVLKAHRLLYHSALGWRVMKKKKKTGTVAAESGQGSTVGVRGLESGDWGLGVRVQG